MGSLTPLELQLVDVPVVLCRMMHDTPQVEMARLQPCTHRGEKLLVPSTYMQPSFAQRVLALHAPHTPSLATNRLRAKAPQHTSHGASVRCVMTSEESECSVLGVLDDDARLGGDRSCDSSISITHRGIGCLLFGSKIVV